MTGSDWLILGAVLIVAGVLLLVASQVLLSRWHKKMIEEL